jgi:hypothetical protein
MMEKYVRWYRAYKNGRMWMESSDPEEVANSGGDEFQKLEETHTTIWVEWDISEYKGEPDGSA